MRGCFRRWRTILPKACPPWYPWITMTSVTLAGRRDKKLFQLPLGICGCEAVQIDFHGGFAGILKHMIASLCEIFSQKDSLLDFIVGYMLK